MENLSVADLTAAPALLAAVARLPAGTGAVVLPFPPARDAREFGRLERTLRRAKVLGVVNHPLLGRPCWAKAMEWLASGVLGAIEHVEVDLRGAFPAGETAGPGTEAPPFTRCLVRGDRGLWAALDFVLRLPYGLPQICFYEKPAARELRSVAGSASAHPFPVIRLTWRPQGNSEPAEQLLIQAANGRLELVAGPCHAVTTVRMILATGHEATAEFSEMPPVQLAIAWARHAASHGLAGGPLALDRLAPFYNWLARP